MPAARFLPLLLALASACFGQGGSAVITLVMPPPGGEGFTALQSGAALAEGAAAAFYNPAALAELQRSTGSSLAFTASRRQLLPILHLPDLYQTFIGGAFTAVDTAGGTDVGIGLYRNHVDFGRNTRTDREGRVLGSSESMETVWGAAIGARLGIPVSVGLGAKFIDSRLAQGVASTGEVQDGVAYGWAFDVGLLAMPRFSTTAVAGVPFVLTPSLAMIAANLGPDVFYNEASQADPIPTTYTFAFGLKAEAWGLVSLTTHAQADAEWTHRSELWTTVDTRGFAVDLVCFDWGVSWLDDKAGRRRERHSYQALDLDPVRLKRALARLGSGDFASAPEDFDRRYHLGYGRAFGGSVRLRPRVIAGLRRIRSYDNGIRDGEKAWFVSFAL